MRIFVYGTLRSGGAAGSLLAGCESLGPAAVNGTLFDVGGRYPAVVLGGEGLVQGEVWRCPDDLLPALDAYEGLAQGLFRREPVEVDGERCWVYVAGPLLEGALVPSAIVPEGEWKGRS